MKKYLFCLLFFAIFLVGTSVLHAHNTQNLPKTLENYFEKRGLTENRYAYLPHSSRMRDILSIQKRAGFLEFVAKFETGINYLGTYKEKLVTMSQSEQTLEILRFWKKVPAINEFFKSTNKNQYLEKITQQPDKILSFFNAVVGGYNEAKKKNKMINEKPLSSSDYLLREFTRCTQTTRYFAKPTQDKCAALSLYAGYLFKEQQDYLKTMKEAKAAADAQTQLAGILAGGEPQTAHTQDAAFPERRPEYPW